MGYNNACFGNESQIQLTNGRELSRIIWTCSIEIDEDTYLDE